MKKLLFVPLVMFLLAGIVFSVSVQPAAAKTIELTYNIPCHGPQQPGVYYPTDYIAKEIGKRTEGRVKVTVFWGATLAPPPETFRAVLKGVCDIGQSNAGYTKGLFPVSDACTLPLGFPNAQVQGHVITDFMAKFKPKEYDDVVLLSVGSPPPFLVGTAKKPVRSFDDFNGLTIRVSGATVAELVKGLGGVPKLANINEVYELLSKGVVDGIYTALEVYPAFKFHEIVKYVTDVRFVAPGAVSYTVMNKNSWNKISPKDQKIIMDLMSETLDLRGEKWDEADRSGKEAFLAAPGREYITLPPAEKAKIKAVAQKTIDAWVKDMTAKGYPAQDYVDYVKERVDYWSDKLGVEM